jgi:hypothetical protein
VAPPYTHRNIGDVEDSAKKYGFDETQETRFPREDLDAEQTGSPAITSSRASARASGTGITMPRRCTSSSRAQVGSTSTETSWSSSGWTSSESRPE